MVATFSSFEAQNGFQLVEIVHKSADVSTDTIYMKLKSSTYTFNKSNPDYDLVVADLKTIGVKPNES